MKKAFIMLSVLGIMFAGFTYAATTKPLTPAQKRIQAIKLAKLKKQQVKTNTWVVNTGWYNTWNCITPIFTWSFSGTNESIYLQASDALSIVKKSVYDLNNMSCMQTYNNISKQYSDWIIKVTKIMNDNYYAYMRDKVNKLAKTVTYDDEVYTQCVEENKKVPYYDRKECWFDPVELLTDLDSKFTQWKKDNNYK